VLEGFSRAVCTSSALHSLRPCLGQRASLGEEAVLADSGRVGEIPARGWAAKKSGLFEHPARVFFYCAKRSDFRYSLEPART
jgi:hypothetical protein